MGSLPLVALGVPQREGQVPPLRSLEGVGLGSRTKKMARRRAARSRPGLPRSSSTASTPGMSSDRRRRHRPARCRPDDRHSGAARPGLRRRSGSPIQHQQVQRLHAWKLQGLLAVGQPQLSAKKRNGRPVVARRPFPTWTTQGRSIAAAVLLSPAAGWLIRRSGGRDEALASIPRPDGHPTWFVYASAASRIGSRTDLSHCTPRR